MKKYIVLGGALIIGVMGYYLYPAYKFYSSDVYKNNKWRDERLSSNTISKSENPLEQELELTIIADDDTTHWQIKHVTLRELPKELKMRLYFPSYVPSGFKPYSIPYAIQIKDSYSGSLYKEGGVESLFFSFSNSGSASGTIAIILKNRKFSDNSLCNESGVKKGIIQANEVCYREFGKSARLEWKAPNGVFVQINGWISADELLKMAKSLEVIN